MGPNFSHKSSSKFLIASESVENFKYPLSKLESNRGCMNGGPS